MRCFCVWISSYEIYNDYFYCNKVPTPNPSLIHPNPLRPSIQPNSCWQIIRKHGRVTPYHYYYISVCADVCECGVCWVANADQSRGERAYRSNVHCINTSRAHMCKHTRRRWRRRTRTSMNRCHARIVCVFVRKEVRNEIRTLSAVMGGWVAYSLWMVAQNRWN